MSISVKTISCPQCGANVKCEEGREKLFCSYCGALIIVTNENEHIYRHIDEADVKRAENERIEMLANMRANEERDKSSAYTKKVKLIVIGVLLTLGIALMIIGSIDNPMLAMTGMLVLEIAGFVGISMIPRKNRNGTSQSTNNQKCVRITSDMENYQNCNYESMATIMKRHGFNNITCIPLKDLGGTTTNQYRDGQISTLTINGDDEIGEGDEYPFNAGIVITYHSYSSESVNQTATTAPVQSTDKCEPQSSVTEQTHTLGNVICTSCGARVPIINTSGIVFCQFCGNKNTVVTPKGNNYQQVNNSVSANTVPNKTAGPNLFITYNTVDPRVGMITRIVSTGVKNTYANGTTLSFCLPQGHQTIVLKIGRINYNRNIVIPSNNSPVKIYASYNGRAQISIDQPAC